MQHITLSAAAGRLAVHFSAEVSGAMEVDAKVTVQPLGDLRDSFVIAFTLDGHQDVFTIEKLSVGTEFPATDMHGMYHPYGGVQDLTHLPFWRRGFASSSTQAPPLWAFLHQNGNNRVAWGLADQLTPTAIDYTLSEHTRSITLSARKPTDGVLRRQVHTEYVFVSLADVPLKELLAAYLAFVDRQQPPQRILHVPVCAYDPVFCTWTAIHADVTPEWTERNARIAVDLGFKTLLMDDGWMDWPEGSPDERLAGGQTYPFLGDWLPHPRKFPDFAGHVKRIQEMGMRYLLWVAPFFMGERYAGYEQFKDKGWYRPAPTRPGGNVYLDPRYPAVVEYVRRTLLRLVNEYHLDGLKIDFVDGVASKVEPNMAPLPLGDEGGSALMDLLGSTIDLLARQNPDLMIECRQGYSNLAARRWTNCYRSPDVPINFHQNRFNCAMLRLLAPDRAVYFDPALWPMDDPDENVGRHMISAISAVPMISIEFDRYPQEHLQIVKHWISFYQTHRHTLMQGRFEPTIRLGHNPLTYFRSSLETIVGLYSDTPIFLDDPRHHLYILNGSSNPWIDFVPGTIRGRRMLRSVSRTGQWFGDQLLEFPLTRLDCEIGGYIRIAHVEETSETGGTGKL